MAFGTRHRGTQPAAQQSNRRTWLFVAIVAIDLIILWLAWNRDPGMVNNDPAGAGMASGFFAGIVVIAGTIVGVLIILYAIIRHRVARLVLIWLLGIYTFPLLALLL